VPEGDTVYLAAQRLHGALADRVLTTSDFRVPHLATVELTGRRVFEVVSRGKHLLTRVEGDLTLHTHLRMADPRTKCASYSAMTNGRRSDIACR